MSESGFKLKGTGAYDRDIANARTSAEIDEINRRYLGRSFGSDVEFDESTQRYRNTKTGQLVSSADLNTEARGGNDSQATNQGGSMYKQDLTLPDGRVITIESSTLEGLTRDVAMAQSVAEALTQGDGELLEAERAAEYEQQQAVEAARQAELKLKFQRGEIGVDEYLSQSGAVATYLESQGINFDSLRHIAQEKEDSAVTQSWADAVNQFLSGVGADWPGGVQNQALIGDAIQLLGLEDSEDKVAALKTAYDYLKQKNVLHPGKSSEEEAAEILKNSSPAEIMEMWKQSELAKGRTAHDLNDEFVKSHSSTGSGLGSGLWGK